MALVDPGVAAWPASRRSDDVLFAARVAGGSAPGMAYPTTLALITALWSGRVRTKSIALWSAIGGGFAALGPLVSGILLEHFDWGSVFLVTLPLARDRARDGRSFVPSHVNETTEPVDNLGGILSVVLVGRADPRDQLLRPSNDMETPRSCLVAIAVAGDARLPPPAAAREQSALRPPDRRPARRSGSQRARGSSSSAR